MSFGTTDSELPHAKSDFGDLGIASAPVTLDTPVGGITPGANQKWPPLFNPANPYDETRAVSRDGFVAPSAVKVAAAKPESKKIVTPPFSDRPAWKADVDGPRADSAYSVASDLRLDTKKMPNTVPGSRFPLLPVLADMNGPFAVIPPAWQKLPYELTLINTGGQDQEFLIKETPQPAVEVIDLRTGKPAGKFDWRIPCWAPTGLSPDGVSLIGPYHVPLAKMSVIPPKEKEALAALYLWKRDSTKPPTQLKLPGYVWWYGFASNELAVALVNVESTQQLQGWDIETGEQRFSLEMPYQPTPPPVFSVPNKAAAIQVGHRGYLVAISPGGKFIAVGGNGKLVLVSVAEPRILGAIEIEASQSDHMGLAFSAAGDEIVMAHGVRRVRVGLTRIIILDATDGRRRFQGDFEGQTGGPLFQVAERAFVLGGMQNAYAALHFTSDDTRGGPFAGLEKVLRVPETGPVLVAVRPVPGAQQLRVQAIDRSLISKGIAAPNPYGMAGEPRTIAIDAATAQVVATSTPANWLPVAEVASPIVNPCNALPCVPWRAQWAEQFVGVVTEDSKLVFVPQQGKHRELTANWSRLDKASSAPIGQPLLLRHWVVEEDYVTPDQFAFAMSADGERFAICDPEFRDRVDIFKSDGTRLFGFQPFGSGSSVDWAEFDAHGKLLVAGNREIAALEIGSDSAKVLYRTSGGGYAAPFVLLPNRKLLAAAHGHSFDIIDTATGTCRNRLGIGTDGVITDIAFAPDGKHAAALYTDHKTKMKFIHHESMSDSTIEATVALWDLTSGQPSQMPVTCTGFGFLAWAGPDHLCLCNKAATPVFDVRLGAQTFSYQANIRGMGTGFGLGKSADGRIWRFDLDALGRNQSAEREGRAMEPNLWKATTATGLRYEQESLYFAADRSIVDVKTTPIRVDIDLGNKQWATSHGEKILVELQTRGHSVGPAGLVLRVQSRVIPTIEVLRFEKGEKVNIPRVDFVWQILDIQGRLAWTGRSTGHFLGEKSRYYKRNEISKSSTAMESLFDFGGKPVERAIVDEVLEKGVGLIVPDELPLRLLLGGGRYAVIPGSLPWRFADSKP